MEVDTTAALAPSAAAADGAGVKLPPHLERIRSRVEIGLSRPTNTAGTYGANTYTPAGYDNSLTPALFAARLSMAVSVSTWKRWRQRPHGQREKKHITGRVQIYRGRTAEQTIRSAHILPLSLSY